MLGIASFELQEFFVSFSFTPSSFPSWIDNRLDSIDETQLSSLRQTMREGEEVEI